MIEILKALVLPSNLSFLLTVIGLALCLHGRTRKAALIALASAGVLLVTFSCGKTATLLLSPLEYAYPRAPDRTAPVQAIVVLGAYVASDPDASPGGRPNSSSLYRVVEGALLWQRCQDCTVVVTGLSPDTHVMAEMLVSLGVPRALVKLDNEAANTGESAVNMHRLLGDVPFYLVTSAGHMPRSMAVFSTAGMHPLPAPTEHRMPRNLSEAEWDLSTFHLECSDLAVHERFGMWWYKLNGRI